MTVGKVLQIPRRGPQLQPACVCLVAVGEVDEFVETGNSQEALEGELTAQV